MHSQIAGPEYPACLQAYCVARLTGQCRTMCGAYDRTSKSRKAAIPRFRIRVRKILMRTPFSTFHYPLNASSFWYLT